MAGARTAVLKTAYCGRRAYLGTAVTALDCKRLRLGVRRYRTPDAGVDPDVVHAAAPDARRDSNRHVSLETTSVRLNCVLYALGRRESSEGELVHMIH